VAEFHDRLQPLHCSEEPTVTESMLRMTKWYNGLRERITNTPSYEKLSFLFPDQIEDVLNVRAIREQHFKAADTMFRNLSRPIEKAIVDIINDYNREDHQVSDKILCAGKIVESRAKSLDQCGHTTLPKLSAKKVQDMLDYFETAGCYAGPYDPDHQDREFFTAKELRAQNENTARYPTKSVALCPHLMRIASDPVIISILTRHLGAMPIILDYSCWWSFAYEEQDSQHAQLYHVDFADYRYSLMNIYLTDVDMKGGPHTIFDSTHEMDQIAKIRDEFSGDKAKWDNWYFTKHRKTDEEMDYYFGGRKATSLTGEKGSTLLVNTRGIHKGMLPTGSDRLLVQIAYGVSPMVQTNFMEPVKIGSPEASHIPASMAETPFDHINWFFATK
jgi:hypothetical protein